MLRPLGAGSPVKTVLVLKNAISVRYSDGITERYAPARAEITTIMPL